MEHKLVYCGKCGLEPDVAVEEYLCDEGPGVEYARCPVGHCMKPSKLWNAAQFAARTERINAAAVALMKGPDMPQWCIAKAEELVAMQDISARVRWAEMQKGE